MGGKTIHSQTRTLALKVLKFFEDEKSNKKFIIPVDQALKRACAATGMSKATLMRIKNEAKKVLPISQNQNDDDTVVSEPRPSTSAARQEPKLSTPGKKRKQSSKKIELDNFDLCALRNIVNSFYTVRKEIPTLKKILAAAKADLNFPGKLNSNIITYLYLCFSLLADSVVNHYQTRDLH